MNIATNNFQTPKHPTATLPRKAHTTEVLQDTIELTAHALEQGAAYTLAALDGISPIPFGAAFAGLRGAYQGYTETQKRGNENTSDLFPNSIGDDSLTSAFNGFLGGCIDGAVRTAITAGVVAVLGGGAVTAGLVGATWGLAQVGLTRWANEEPPFGPKVEVRS